MFSKEKRKSFSLKQLIFNLLVYIYLIQFYHLHKKEFFANASSLSYSSSSLSSSNFNNNKNLNILNKILSQTASFQSQNKDQTVLAFINKIAQIPDTPSMCHASLLQSDIQAKLRNLRSFISTCSDYCRLAMNQDGHVYGAKEFNLDTIWNRIDISNEQLMRQSALLGAYYIKFIQADKYLCINANGQLFSSKIHQTKGCLWFNDWPRLISAQYKNVQLKKSSSLNCQFESTNLNTNRMRKFRRRSAKLDMDSEVEISQREEQIKYNFNDDEEDDSETEYLQNNNQKCLSRFNITSGFSGELQAFVRKCQSQLLPKHQSQQSTSLNEYSISQTSLPKYSSSSLSPSSSHQQNTIFSTDDIKQHFSKLKIQAARMKIINKINVLKNKTEKLCYKYWQEQQHQTSNDEQIKLPTLCYKYINNQATAQKSASTQTGIASDFNNNYDMGEYNLVYNYDESPQNDLQPQATQQNAKQIANRKCYSLRNKPGYSECMNKYYKCFKYNNDIEQLKKCRKRNGIVLPARRRTL